MKYMILDFIFRKFKVHPSKLCKYYKHCCNYGDFDCSDCKKQDYWHKNKNSKSKDICQWCFEKPPVKDGVYCRGYLDVAQQDDKQFDLEKWSEEI
jgi:hypothetical protein